MLSQLVAGTVTFAFGGNDAGKSFATAQLFDITTNGPHLSIALHQGFENFSSATPSDYSLTTGLDGNTLASLTAYSEHAQMPDDATLKTKIDTFSDLIDLGDKKKAELDTALTEMLTAANANQMYKANLDSALGYYAIIDTVKTSLGGDLSTGSIVWKVPKEDNSGWQVVEMLVADTKDNLLAKLGDNDLVEDFGLLFQDEGQSWTHFRSPGWCCVKRFYFLNADLSKAYDDGSQDTNYAIAMKAYYFENGSDDFNDLYHELGNGILRRCSQRAAAW